MRLALLLALALLVGCGSHHHSTPDPHPPSAAFNRLVGSWTATSYNATGGYHTTALDGTTGTFEVDQRGHLTGTAGAQAIELWLSAVSGTTTEFQGTRTRTDGATESVVITLTPDAASDDALMSDSTASTVHWHLTPVTAPG